MNVHIGWNLPLWRGQDPCMHKVYRPYASLLQRGVFNPESKFQTHMDQYMMIYWLNEIASFTSQCLIAAASSISIVLNTLLINKDRRLLNFLLVSSFGIALLLFCLPIDCSFRDRRTNKGLQLQAKVKNILKIEKVVKEKVDHVTWNMDWRGMRSWITVITTWKSINSRCNKNY